MRRILKIIAQTLDLCKKKEEEEEGKDWRCNQLHFTSIIFLGNRCSIGFEG